VPLGPSIRAVRIGEFRIGVERRRCSRVRRRGGKAETVVMTPFVEAISPAPMRARLAEMCRDNTPTRILSWILGPQGFLIWAHCLGLVTDVALRACVSAVPPRELRQGTAAPDEAEFLWTGLVDLRNFLELQDRFGRKPADRKLRVLDFACGSGRLSRYLAMHPEVEGYGVDVNPDLVAWCQTQLPGVRTLLNRPAPPMAFRSGFFDLAFALSVFSHLPERRGLAWLADVARVMVPGGLLIATTHGIPTLKVIRNSPRHHAMFGLDEAEVDALMERLPHEGFIYRRYDADALRKAKAGHEYGNAFIHPDYIARTWNTDLLELVEHIPGGLRGGWQDCVLLRRK
jgi:SAM-dependent methyltransferase